MDTQLKPQIHAYIAYQYIDPAHEEGLGTWELIGWDTVNADQKSVYQAMLGTTGVDIYLWEFTHPDRALFRWSNYQGWERVAAEYQLRTIPKDLQMKALVGAL